LGVPLVTGDIPGVAVILGAAPTAEEGVELVKSYQAQGILVTLVGGIIDQCTEVGYKTGANVRVIPLGKDVTSVVHAVSVAVRAALIFGNIEPGDAAGLMKYTFERVPAFVNARSEERRVGKGSRRRPEPGRGGGRKATWKVGLGRMT